ncbi:MAG: winged helix-turn-helix transcriptional regulator [Bacteroidetes bacterium]|nr:winged helix-turn-helix transcriptional regulator [Bacteroidota bacterium]
MSIFNLENQNKSIDSKIAAGLERLSQVFRILLWEKAKEQSLSPIQIQLLIFIHNHSSEKTTISYMAQEFNLTKPTISDAVKVLEQKKLVKKNIDSNDTRSYTIQLTSNGKKAVSETENYVQPLTQLIEKAKKPDKKILWQLLVDLITQLNKMEIISIQRTCFNCTHFSSNNNSGFCNLLNKKLDIQDIRIDCEDFITKN